MERGGIAEELLLLEEDLINKKNRIRSIGLGSHFIIFRGKFPNNPEMF